MIKTILLVDDAFSDCELFSQILTSFGYRVTAVRCCGEALESIKRQKPDLVLLDFKMPGRDGMETLRLIKDFDDDIKVVIFTAADDEEVAQKAYKLRADGFLRKDEEIGRINETIASIVKTPERKGKILVADDDPQIVNLVTGYLRKKNFLITTTSRGDEALEKFKAQKPDLVLLDIDMPGMDGITVLKHIREIDRKTGVIMVTGLADDKLFCRAKELGAYEYIIKPFNLAYLELCIMVRMALTAAAS